MPPSRFPRLLLLTLLCLSTLAQAQTQAQTQEPTTQPQAAATQPTTQPTAGGGGGYELADIPTQADTTATALEDITRSLESNGAIDAIADALPTLTQQVTTHLAETSRLLTPSVSLDILRTQERDWSDIRDVITDRRKELADRLADLDTYQRRLADLEKSWSATALPLRAPAGSTQPGEAGSPTTRTTAEVLNRVEAILRDIRRAQSATNRQRTGVVSLQNQLSALEVRTSEMLLTLRRASDRAFSRLLTPDSSPLWAPLFSNAPAAARGGSLAQQSTDSFSSQLTELQSFASRAWPYFIRHATLITLITLALLWIRKRVRKILAEDPSAIEEAVIFDMPLSTAIVASMLVATVVYPVAPRIFWFILGSLVLIPTARVLRRLISPNLLPLLNGQILFIFVGLLQNVIAPLPTLSRWVYLLQMLGAAAFLAYHLYQRRLAPIPSPDQQKKLVHPHARTALALSLRIAFALALTSALANILGYVALAKLLATALVFSGYIALILHAGVVLADTLVMGAMSIPPIASLRMVKNRSSTIRLWFHRLFILIAAYYWLQRTLSLLVIWRPLTEKTYDILTAKFEAGALKLSLGGVLSLAIAILASIALSRFTRFLLEEDVYPRVKLAKGIPYAISTMIHYVILLLGFLAAISQIYDMTQFTILASAFGIGLGFGMQNIVNNFVSGLILLFERPVRVGDIIELGNQSATVTRIGIRASVVRLNNAAEIIIPNGQLISEKVTNWTLSNRQRGLELNLAIAPSETHTPPQILDLLCKEATANPLIATNPTPKAVITAMTGESFTYQLRAWTNKYEDWTTVRSQLLESLHTKLKQEGLTLK